MRGMCVKPVKGDAVLFWSMVCYVNTIQWKAAHILHCDFYMLYPWSSPCYKSERKSKCYDTIWTGDDENLIFGITLLDLHTLFVLEVSNWKIK